MTAERILYLGSLKFIFQGMLILVPTGTLTPHLRRMLWGISKEKAEAYSRDYLNQRKLVRAHEKAKETASL